MNMVKNLFGINLMLMRIFGYYPPKKYNLLYNVYTYCVYIFCTTAVPTLALLYLFFKEDLDIDQIADQCFIMIQVGCFIFKLFPFLLRSNQIRACIYMLNDPIFNTHRKSQEKYIRDCIKTCHKISYFNLSFVFTAFIFFAVTPLFSNEGLVWFLPIEIWLPFNFKSNMTTYVASYLFITIGVCNGAHVSGALDPLIAGLACFATHQLKILNDNLSNLSQHCSEKLESFSKSPTSNSKQFTKNYIIFEEIKQCLVHHNAIINFVRYYEKTYSSVVFTQFTASILVICFSCWELTRVEPFTIKFYYMVVFLVTMLLEIFLFSFFGTTLYEEVIESNNITTAIYNSNWYEYDFKSKQALFIIMERSKEPLIVTAGKILDLSLVTFTTILRRAYSLLAVLNNYE